MEPNCFCPGETDSFEHCLGLFLWNKRANRSMQPFGNPFWPPANTFLFTWLIPAKRLSSDREQRALQNTFFPFSQQRKKSSCVKYLWLFIACTYFIATNIFLCFESLTLEIVCTSLLTSNLTSFWKKSSFYEGYQDISSLLKKDENLYLYFTDVRPIYCTEKTTL